MAKKNFDEALRRRTPQKKKLPIDIEAVESVAPVPQEEKIIPSPTPPKAKTKVIRTSFNLPEPIHEAMRQHCFKLRINMKDYLVSLVKNDLEID